MPDSLHHSVVIIGGGTAGLTVAARLLRSDRSLDVAIIEPSDKHYYQPLWTLVGGGVMDRTETEREESDYIPSGSKWIRDKVASVDADSNKLTLASGGTVGYDFLVVCPGIQIDWAGIDGLEDSLGKNGVCSNYSYDLVPYTWETLKPLSGGRLIFTQPATPIKCGGAPQKIMYLAADHLRRKGAAGKSSIRFMSPGGVIFGVKEFAATLNKVIDRYGIQPNFQTELVQVRGAEQKAVFRVTDPETGEQRDREEDFDMIHVVPPQSSPDFIKSSSLANETGWVDVNRSTLQHVRYPNVFSLGDSAGTPNAKTGAAVRKQAPVVVANLVSMMRGGKLDGSVSYNGYSSCPLVTGYGKLVLAEFDYDNKPDPSFPFDTTKERLSMYLMKRHALPILYWHGMLKGRA